jgi:hypothetical protein
MKELSMVSADELNQIEGGMFRPIQGTVVGIFAAPTPKPPLPPSGAVSNGGGQSGGGLVTIDGRDWFQMN